MLFMSTKVNQSRMNLSKTSMEMCKVFSKSNTIYCYKFWFLICCWCLTMLQYLVQSAVDGYNVCIFAYGQTGSGKTFTIFGSDSNPGLTPRAISELFRVIKRDSTKYSFSLKVSHF